MKICVVSYHSSPLEPVGAGNSGGMNIVILNLYRTLSQICDVDIFVRGKGGCVRLGHKLNLIYLNRKNTSVFADDVMAYHNKNQYDLIHTHYWRSGIIGLLMRRVIKIPWLHTLHTVEILKNIKRDEIRIEIEEEIIRCCDAIVSPTHQEALALRELYPGVRVITIPHGVDTKKFTPSDDGHANILYVGRIDPIKGLDLLIDALKISRRDIRLDIVGGPSKDEHNLESIKTYADGMLVNFAGLVEHDRLVEYYRKTSMVIVPSYYESFGLVGLEAMASARPVIGFADTGLSETVGNDAGILVKRNANNLAWAIEYLSDNKELRHKLGSKGRRKVLNYNWADIADEYLKTYAKIIKR